MHSPDGMKRGGADAVSFGGPLVMQGVIEKMEIPSELIGTIFLLSGCFLMLLTLPGIFLFSKYVERTFGVFDAKEVFVSSMFASPIKYNFTFFNEFSTFMKLNAINFIAGAMFYCGLAFFAVVFCSFMGVIMLGYIK